MLELELFAADFWRFLRAFHFWRRVLFMRRCLLFEFAIDFPVSFWGTSAPRILCSAPL